ncbi:YjzC family protein [Paenibacillus alkalitolerans]|uniref:YjzC family protein n=1 Tax=Paenibacillus alkalitolerans TaxID=2799335 RepID=UPI0018F364C8|nr:YjzC family protein [Paenibacillus alkalitolerans]
MGERTELRPGDKAPNDGRYMEVGVDDFHMGIEGPQRVVMKKGQKLPDTQNPDRRWQLTRKNHPR